MRHSKVKMLKSYDEKEIERKINKHLNKGYKLFGNIVVTPDKDFFILVVK